VFKQITTIIYYFLAAYLISMAVTFFDVVLNVFIRPYNIRGLYDGLNFLAEDGVANFLLIIVSTLAVYVLVVLFGLIRKGQVKFGINQWPYVFGTSGAMIGIGILAVQLKFNVLGALFERGTLIVAAVLICAIPVVASVFIFIGKRIRVNFTGRAAKILYFGLAVIYTVLIFVGFSFDVKYGNVFREESEGGPNILVIVVDALRRDHVSYYGYDYTETPNIDEFASDSVVFTDAYTNAPWTIPSIYTMNTSRYPSVHGAEFTRRGNDKLAVMAELLRENGYDTEAYIANPVLDREIGFARGFDSYVKYEDFSPLMFIRRSTLYFLIESARVWKDQHSVADTTGWLTGVLCDRLRVKRNKPFFIYAHYLDPHQPLNPPLEYVTGDQSFVERAVVFMDRQKPDILEDDKDVATLLYRAEVEYIDYSLGKIFDVLAEEGLTENTLIIITADHGEEHFEHGRYGHGTTHYKEVMEIPLILHAPDVRPAVSDYPVSIVDIMPTIVNYVGVEVPGGSSGRDLFALIGSEPEGFSESALFFDNTGPTAPTLRSIYVKPYILIRSGENDYEYELVDVTVEIGRDDRVENPDAELFEEYKTVLDDRAAEVALEAVTIGKGEEVKIDDAHGQRLRDLGYF
jgi:arylsulfatase A-like enzyme